MATSRKRQSAKRKSAKRKSVKRKSAKRKSASRQPTRRQSAGRKTAARTITTDTAAKRPLIVTLSSDRAIDDVKRDLEAAGLHVDQVLDATGIVTGSADAKHVARLRRVKGVSDVSADYPVDIGPPDADVS